MWFGHEGGTLMNGLMLLKKETQESSPATCTTWGPSENTAPYKPGSGTSPDTESAGSLILEFPAPEL